MYNTNDMKKKDAVIVGAAFSGLTLSALLARQGMKQRAGAGAPSSLSRFQSQHACAAGTVALSSMAGLLSARGGFEW